MKRVQKYRDSIVKLHINRGTNGEADSIKAINDWYESKWITYSEKEHLLKFNKNLSK